MMIYRIHSRSNQRVKDLIKNKNEFFVFEGEKLVQDILERHLSIEFLIVNESRENELDFPPKIPIKETWLVSGQVLDKISSLKETPDLIAVLKPRERSVDFKKANVVIGLDNIQDPANAGTVFRCAAAFNIDAVVTSGSSVGFTNTKFLRGAQDAFFEVPHQWFDRVETLIDNATKANPKINIYLTSSVPGKQSILPHQIKTPCLILIGSEGSGLPEELFLDFPSIKIPQYGKVKSLNAGVSACIIMYAIAGNINLATD